MRVLLIDCEDAYTLNIYDYLKQCDVDVDIVLHQNVVVDEIRNYAALVLSPGPKSPNEIPILTEVIMQYRWQLPILGICLSVHCCPFQKHLQSKLLTSHSLKSIMGCSQPLLCIFSF